MRISHLYLSLLLILLLATACQKDQDFTIPDSTNSTGAVLQGERQYSNAIEQQFFDLHAPTSHSDTNTEVNCPEDSTDWSELLLNLTDKIYQLNELEEFVPQLTELAGFPQWNKVWMQYQSEDLLVYSIPFLKATDQRVEVRLVILQSGTDYTFRLQSRAFIESGVDRIDDPHGWLGLHLVDFTKLDACVFGEPAETSTIVSTGSATIRNCWWYGNQCVRLEGNQLIVQPVSCCGSSGNTGGGGSSSGSGSTGQAALPTWWTWYWSLRNSSGSGSSTSNPTDPSSGGGGGIGLGIGNDPEPGGNGSPLDGLSPEELEQRFLLAYLTIQLDLTQSELDFLVNNEISISYQLEDLIQQIGPDLALAVKQQTLLSFGECALLNSFIQEHLANVLEPAAIILLLLNEKQFGKIVQQVYQSNPNSSAIIIQNTQALFQVYSSYTTLNFSSEATSHLLLNPSLITTITNFVNTRTDLLVQARLEASEIHAHLMATDENYKVFVESEYPSIPGWMWPILKEIGQEVAIELIKRNSPLSSYNNIIDAVNNLSQGDILGFMGEVLDIVKSHVPALKLVNLSLDGIELGGKAVQVWRVVAKLEHFGSQAIGNILDAIHNIAGGILGKIRWKGLPEGAIMPESIQPLALLEDMADLFGKEVQLIGNNWKFHPECCNISVIEIYPDSNTTGPGYWTLAITSTLGGYQFKIRFTD